MLLIVGFVLNNSFPIFGGMSRAEVDEDVLCKCHFTTTRPGIHRIRLFFSYIRFVLINVMHTLKLFRFLKSAASSIVKILPDSLVT